MFSDVVVVLLAAAASVGVVAERGSMLRPHGGATATVLVLTACALAFRRRAPLAVAWVTVAPMAALHVVETIAPGTLLRLGPGVDVGPVPCWTPAVPFAAYAAMAYGGASRFSRTRAAPLVLMAVLILLVTEILPDTVARSVAGRETDTLEAMVFRSVVLLAGGALLGLYVAARRRVVQGLTERTERAERERHLLAEQARADERARLAAEMHDVVAHRVTLMVLQAGALRVRAPDEPTRAAAEELRGTGCQALDELRDVIGLLRRTAEGGDAPSGDASAPGPLPDLSTLIEESASVGVPVELAEEGDPPLASPVAGRTAYRVVQEALTNVRKHAPGARVRVEAHYRVDGVRLTVRNTAPTGAVDADLAGSGSGAGLAGLRERVEVIGGTFRAERDPDGGFTVDASLPAFVPTAAAPVPAPRAASAGLSEPSGMMPGTASAADREAAQGAGAERGPMP